MKISKSIDIKSYGVLVAIIIVFWLPFIIGFAPGNIDYDGKTQLLEYFGRLPHYDHHPVFITHFYGAIIRLGANIIDFNFGALLVVIFQVLICAISFARECMYIKNVGGKIFFFCYPYVLCRISIVGRLCYMHY